MRDLHRFQFEGGPDMPVGSDSPPADEADPILQLGTDPPSAGESLSQPRQAEPKDWPLH